MEQERDEARTEAADAEAARIAAQAAAATAATAVGQAATDLLAAQQGGQAANPQVQAPPKQHLPVIPAPNPVMFALSPALATNALINYQSGEGMKIYGEPLHPSMHCLTEMPDHFDYS
jgi:hypothetical protein